MWRGLYIAASGMITETKHTDMIANNLANADTTGFKRDDMAIRKTKNRRKYSGFFGRYETLW